MLGYWQLEAYAVLQGLAFPPPEWAVGAIERAATPTVWVAGGTFAPRSIRPAEQPTRPTLVELPIAWAMNWFAKKEIHTYHLPQFENAFVGVGLFPRSQPSLIYDRDEVLNYMIDEAGDTGLGVALFENKLLEAYYGDGSPGFLTRFSMDDEYVRQD